MYKVGDLTLDRDEARTYLIVQEAIKNCPMAKRVSSLENEVHGKDGGNGIASKVRTHQEMIEVNRKVIIGVIASLVTIVTGSTVSLITYLLIAI